MNEHDLLDALGGLDAETVFNAKVFTPAKRRRFPLGALIAAAVALILTVGSVSAAYVVHQRTARLLAAGPRTSGSIPVTLKDADLLAIDQYSKDLELQAEDGGVTVTLHSFMGYSTGDVSLLYFTLTLDPEAHSLPDDLSDYGFRWWFPAGERTAGGSSVAMKNPDGTADVLLLYYCDGNLDGQPLDLELKDFGDLSKEAMTQGEGSPTSVLPGTWRFHLDQLPLEKAQALDLTRAAFPRSLLKPKEIFLTGLGGTLTLENSYDTWYTVKIRAHSAELSSLAPEFDWTGMTAEELWQLHISGAIPLDKLEQIYAIIDENTDPRGGTPGVLHLITAEGTYYSANTTVYWEFLPDGGTRLLYLFEAPQDLSQAAALVLDGVEIPLD